MVSQMYDLIIIGGGPSGSSAGRIAAKNGLKTLLLEKEEFPRYKPCGGALSEHAMSYLDFEIPRDIIERDIHGGRFRFGDKDVEYYKDLRVSVIVTRSIFDNFLLEKAKEAGVEVHCKEKVRNISQNGDHVSVTTATGTYEGRYAIISTGSQGTLKNIVRRPDNKEEYGVCLVTEIQRTDEEVDNYIKDALELHFGISGLGYGWIFPHRGYFSVGSGSVMAKHLPDPKKAMLDYLELNGFTGEYKLNGHVIPCGGHKRKLVKDRIILSGDAAGFVDAFTGEGLAYAIRSGQIAAETISHNLKNKKDIKHLISYEKRCHSEFGEHLRYSLLVAKFMHRYPEKAFNALISKTDILDMFVEVVIYNKTYKDLVKWLILNFKFGWLRK